jgi:hypothetical protein
MRCSTVVLVQHITEINRNKGSGRTHHWSSPFRTSKCASCNASKAMPSCENTIVPTRYRDTCCDAERWRSLPGLVKDVRPYAHVVYKWDLAFRVCSSTKAVIV